MSTQSLYAHRASRAVVATAGLTLLFGWMFTSAWAEPGERLPAHGSAAPPSGPTSVSVRRRSHSSSPTGPSPVEFWCDQSWQTGLHLLDSGSESLVMSRDGWLHTLAGTQREAGLRAAREPFQVASASEVRNRLRAEFGKQFEVVATNQFLVVQPRGRGRRWPDLFENSHRVFVDFMRKRGVQVRQGRFPMVAVVMPDARAMYSEFDRLGLDVGRVSGLYANRCNRVMTHDGGSLASIAATVRHEAAHQSAFNTGVHSRVNDTPGWITEGIGQLFEPPAMADGVNVTRLDERVNQESLQQLRRHMDLNDPAAVHRIVHRLVTGDEMFQDPSTVHTAYAMAWAMMFYLSEKQTEQFADLLNFTSTRAPFETYLPGQRRIDFERVTGQELRMFAARLTGFLSGLN